MLRSMDILALGELANATIGATHALVLADLAFEHTLVYVDMIAIVPITALPVEGVVEAQGCWH